MILTKIINKLRRDGLRSVIYFLGREVSAKLCHAVLSNGKPAGELKKLTSLRHHNGA